MRMFILTPNNAQAEIMLKSAEDEAKLEKLDVTLRDCT